MSEGEGETWFCGDRLTLQPSEHQRMIVACVDDPGHAPDIAHRSGTDPVLRWRTNRHDPNVRDVWVEPPRDFYGLPALGTVSAATPIECPTCHTTTMIVDREVRHPVDHSLAPGVTPADPPKLLAHVLGCGHRVDPADHTLIVESVDDGERTTRWVSTVDQR